MSLAVIATGIAGSQLVTTCWQGAVGNYFHGGCEWLRKTIPAGTPENHDVLKAMHRCFREATQLIADACADVDGADRDSRTARRKLSDYARSAKLGKLDLEHPDLPGDVLEEQVRAIYGQQEIDARVAATNAVIVFIESEIGYTLTPALRDVFHNGKGKVGGWAATFELLFSTIIKTNERVRSILLATRANELVALNVAAAEQIAVLFDHLETIEAKIEQGFAEQREKLDEILGILRAEGRVPEQQLAGFEQATEQLIRSDDAADRAAASQVLEGDPLAAADALMAEVSAGRTSSADRARQAARLYAPFSPSKALAAYREAVDLDPIDIWSWIERGRLEFHYASLADARACFQSALQRVGEPRDRSVLHTEFGDLLMAEGDLKAARLEYEAGLAIDEALAKTKPSDPEWQRDLSISYSKLGDVEVAAGKLAAARSRFDASLAIRELLAQHEPDNAEWQRGLSFSYSKLGDLEVAAGNFAAARSRFETSLAIRKLLAQREPDNVEWQRDLSVSYTNLGDIEVAAGNLAVARSHFEASLAIDEKFAQRETGNAGWQRDLSVTNNKLGAVELAAGNLAAARSRFEASLSILEALAQREPGNAEWQRDLSVGYSNLGNVEAEVGNLTAARSRFEACLAIRETLVRLEPDNAGWRRDLSISYEKLGDVEKAAGNFAEARERFEACLTIREALAQHEPGNAGWQRDLAVCYTNLGDVEVVANNLAAARSRFEASLAIDEALAQREPGNAEWQRDLFISHLKLAVLSEAEEDTARALEVFRVAEIIIAKLAEWRPDHPGFSKDLAQVRRNIQRLNRELGIG